MPRPLGKPKEHGTAVQVGNEAPGGLVKPGDHTPILPIRYLGDPPARFFHKRGLMEKMSHPNRAKRSEGCNMLQLCLDCFEVGNLLYNNLGWHPMWSRIDAEVAEWNDDPS